MKPRISVLLPTKNRCEPMKECLDSLVKQTFKNFEVVIVDGGSTDGTKELVEKYSKKLKIKFDFQSGGLIKQENKGWKIAEGDIVIRTDDDVITEPGWLEAVDKTFRLSDKIGGVTGPTLMPEERQKYRDLFFFQERLNNGGFFWKIIGKVYFDYFLEGEAMRATKWFRSGAFSLGSNYPDCLKIKEPFEVSHQEACNMATRRDLLEKTGGFDETYVGIGEYNEPDVSFNVRKLGYKIMFNPRAVVHHLPSKAGFFNERPNAYGRIMNFINFYFKHIKPNSVDKFLRFNAYLLFLNLFFIHQFMVKREVSQLGCIPATFAGLLKNIFKPESWRGGIL